MPRQDLPMLQAMCKDAGKVAPDEWPEGLIGVGPDMRRWVKAQEDAPAPVKKASTKKAAPKKAEPVLEDVDEGFSGE